MLAKGVLDGLERLTRVPAKELVREDLADPRGRLDPAHAPVLVHEFADERLGVRPAEDLHPVRLVAKRPQDQHVLEPLDPAALLDRGAPFGHDARDVCAPAAFEPFCRFLAVLGDEGAGDGVDELCICSHVVLPERRNRSGSSRRLSPNRYRTVTGAPSDRSPRLRVTIRRWGAAHGGPRAPCRRGREGRRANSREPALR